MSFSDCTLITELLAVVFGIIHYKKYFGTPLKYFLFHLILVFLVEGYFTFEYYFSSNSIKNNTIIYNILDAAVYSFYYYLYYCFCKSTIHRKIIFCLGIVFITYTILNFIFFQQLSTTGLYHSYSFTIGALFLTISVGMYIVELLKSDEILYIKKNLLFWISTGLLIFHIGVLPFFISLQFLDADEINFHGLTYILFTLGAIMYSCFIFGFIWSKRLSS